jgi:hypothetical protein
MQLVKSGLVKVIRTAGQGLDSVGKIFEACPYEEKCTHFETFKMKYFHILNLYFVVIPSTRCVKYGNTVPKINATFVASSATVIGDVKIGLKSSIWYGSVIRGKFRINFHNLQSSIQPFLILF